MEMICTVVIATSRKRSVKRMDRRRLWIDQTRRMHTTGWREGVKMGEMTVDVVVKV